MNIAQEYADQVKHGRIVTGKYIQLAIDRYYNDLDRAKKDKSWGYEYNHKLGTAYLDFFGTLRHGKGKWRKSKFELMPWAAFIIWNAYGWTQRYSINRRFMEVYIEVARKNAKTELMAGVGLCGFYMDSVIYGEKDPEIYWYATKKDQAKIGWDRQHEMTKMLRADSKRFANYCGVSTYGIFTTEGSGKVSYLGKDSDTEDGPTPHYGIGDEKHAHKTDDMNNVIRSGFGTRSNPMMWDITTAGFNINGPCYEQRKVCIQVLEGSVDNDLLFPMIFCLDKDDDWEDRSNWIKANPALPYIDTLMPYMEKEFINAKTKGKTKEVNYKTKNLNEWTTTSSTWVPDEIYMKGKHTFDVETLVGKECWGGLDLSSKRDTTALALFFPMQDGLDRHRLIWLSWLPKETAEEREKNDAVPYLKWAGEKLIHLTEGNAIDYDYIYQTITGDADTRISRAEKKELYYGKSIADSYIVKGIAYDRWRDDQVVAKLIDKGVPMEPFGQGFASMAKPTDELEVMLYKQMIQHNNNPLARWHFSNVLLRKDPAGNVKPDKEKSTEKIDFVVSAIMAIGLWMNGRENNDSKYIEEEIFVFDINDPQWREQD